MEISSERLAVLGGYSFKNLGDFMGGYHGRQSPSGYKERALDVKFKWLLPRNWLPKPRFVNLVQKEVPVYQGHKLEDYAINHINPQERRLGYVDTPKKSQS